MTLKQLKAAAKENGYNIYKVRKVRQGGYNVEYSVQIDATTQTNFKPLSKNDK
jgi:hypothetical protein